MRLIDADSAISKIKDEIERYKERIQQWNDNKTDRSLYDVDLKIKDLQRNVTDAEIEIKCLKQYETVSDKEIRDKAIEEFKIALLKQGIIDKSVVRRVAEQMKETNNNG